MTLAQTEAVAAGVATGDAISCDQAFVLIAIRAIPKKEKSIISRDILFLIFFDFIKPPTFPQCSGLILRNPFPFMLN